MFSKLPATLYKCCCHPRIAAEMEMNIGGKTVFVSVPFGAEVALPFADLIKPLDLLQASLPSLNSGIHALGQRPPFLPRIEVSPQFYLPVAKGLSLLAALSW